MPGRRSASHSVGIARFRPPATPTCIEDMWPDERSRADLWRYWDIAHDYNQTVLHGDSLALQRAAGGRNASDAEATRIGLMRPLAGAFWIYCQLLGLTADQFRNAAPHRPPGDLDALRDRIPGSRLSLDGRRRDTA